MPSEDFRNRWTSRFDSSSWLIKHYGSFIDVLDELQNRTNDRNYTNATSYKLTLLNFEIVMVAVIIQYLLGYLRRQYIALQNVDCDRFNPI